MHVDGSVQELHPFGIRTTQEKIGVSVGVGVGTWGTRLNLGLLIRQNTFSFQFTAEDLAT